MRKHRKNRIKIIATKKVINPFAYILNSNNFSTSKRIIGKYAFYVCIKTSLNDGYQY